MPAKITISLSKKAKSECPPRHIHLWRNFLIINPRFDGKLNLYELVLLMVVSKNLFSKSFTHWEGDCPNCIVIAFVGKDALRLSDNIVHFVEKWNAGKFIRKILQGEFRS